MGGDTYGRDSDGNKCYGADANNIKHQQDQGTLRYVRGSIE